MLKKFARTKKVEAQPTSEIAALLDAIPWIMLLKRRLSSVHT